MKTTMKKLTACLLVLLLVLQIMPVFAEGDEPYMATYTPGNITYRDTLEIMSSSTDGKLPSMIYVNSTLQLKATDGYTDLVWSSENSDVAVVDDGLVTAVKAGRVKITVTSGEYSDSIILQVVGEAAEEQAQEEETGKTVIIINGGKTKTEYNGQEHKNEFTAVTDKGENVTDSVHLTETGIAHQATATNCGTVRDAYEPSDFVYDGDVNTEFVISNGWLQIKPLPIKIKANDITITEGEEPQYTAYVSEGLLEGDTIDLSALTFETSGNIISPLVNPGEVIGNYRVANVFPGTLTVTPSPKYNGTYLLGIMKVKNGGNALLTSEVRSDKRLTTVKYEEADQTGMIKEPSKLSYWKFEMQDSGKYYISSEGKYININNAAISMSSTPQELIIEDAGNGKIAIKNDKGYRLNLKGENVVNGVQGSNWNTKDNLPPAANETFTRYTGVYKASEQNNSVEQDLYNMLCVDGNNDYYRLKKSTITAKPLSTYKKVDVLKAGEYIIENYDFTNVVVVIDGEAYKYSDHELTGDYESYFTVKFDRVVTQERINGNDTWYNNDLGWLDGSKEQYGTLPNKTPGFHANYNATTHKGTKKAVVVEEVEETNMSVSITSDWPEDRPAYSGTKITLTAHLIGFEGREYTLQWQYTTDGKNWTNKDGANGETFTYELNESTAKYTWRVVATNIK